MQSRLKKMMTLTVLAIALPVVAFGQAARVEGLDVQGDYIKDYTNIFAYPSCVPNVGNLVYGDFGQSDYYGGGGAPQLGVQYAGQYTYDRSIGAVLGNLWDGKFGTFSFHMRDQAPELGTPNTWLDTGLLGYDPNSGGYNQAFDLMWGKKFGTMSLGLRVNRTFHKFTPDSTKNDYNQQNLLGDGNYDRNSMGFGGGLGFELNPNTKAEVAFLYESRKFETKNYSYYNWMDDGSIYGNLKEDGGAAYLASARLMWQWQPNVMVIPVFKMFSFDLSSTFHPNQDPTVNGALYRARDTLDTHTEKGWQVGLAGNWTLNQNDLFVAGFTFASSVDEQKTDRLGSEGYDGRYYSYRYKDTYSTMPTMFAALETHVNPWLTLRFGGDKVMFGNDKYTEVRTYEQGGTPVQPLKREVITKYAYSDFSMHLGAGVKLGTLQFDGTLIEDFFHNPTTYLFGNNSYPLFGRVSATYSF